MKTKTYLKFDYYIFLDYSKNLIGYTIFCKDKINLILSLITKIKHYKNVKHRKLYLKSIKKIIYNSELLSNIYKINITKVSNNLQIFSDVLDFLKNNHNSIIFTSIDDNQFISFKRLTKIADLSAKIVKESTLKKDSTEYRLSLIIDNMLNIERMSK